MFPTVSIDGEQQAVTDDVEHVLVEFDSDREAVELADQCAECGRELDSDGHAIDDTAWPVDCPERITDEPDEEGNYDHLPHVPAPIALSWVNSAGIHLDESEDSVTVTVSVGDPRGAFAFTVRRIPVDSGSELAGRLIMHTPYPGEGSPHMPLRELHTGTYVIGD